MKICWLCYIPIPQPCNNAQAASTSCSCSSVTHHVEQLWSFDRDEVEAWLIGHCLSGDDTMRHSDVMRRFTLFVETARWHVGLYLSIAYEKKIWPLITFIKILLISGKKEQKYFIKFLNLESYSVSCSSERVQSCPNMDNDRTLFFFFNAVQSQASRFPPASSFYTKLG